MTRCEHVDGVARILRLLWWNAARKHSHAYVLRSKGKQEGSSIRWARLHVESSEADPSKPDPRHAATLTG